ncbi:MAG: M23 family metallopeptidase [Acidobacteria bacterium]|nr:M23 family metallopeptidase [Acidobacteriota bacterium]
MRAINFLLVISALLIFHSACVREKSPDKEIPAHLLDKFPMKSFAYPVGEKDYVSEKNDWRDAWYNAQDFGENRHLGEDWNKTTGGNTDCGESVYAAGSGQITFAKEAGAGWGNVIIIEHTAPDGTKIQSLYGHLETITRTDGAVKRREQIGTIGGANGRYPCHLHFEIRWTDCPVWNQTGNGYADEKQGWIDPSGSILILWCYIVLV